ncbi:MAG: T9SS type A sorting domain-containing protein [Saprospiraceae bacterium]
MKKHLPFLLTLVFYFSITISCQCFFSNNALPPCPSGNVVLINQAEIDDWVAQNNGCDIIDGILMIGPNSIISDINDISGLSSIVEITGDFIMNKTVLTDFTGLENLASIGGNFEISTTTITDFEGLENLQSVGGDFMIEHAEPLINMNGLNNLNSIGGNLSFNSCANLESLSALNNLSFLGGDLGLNSVPNLDDLDGLQSLTEIGGGLSFAGNFNASLNGLQNLTTIGGTLYAAYTQFTDFAYLENLTSVNALSIGSNYYLTDLSALAGITSVVAEVTISGNNNLTNLNGLHNLTSVGTNLAIHSNDLLTNIEALENVTSVGDVLSVSYNETLASLQGLHNVSLAGGIYIAENDILESINELNNITTVVSLRIENNPALINLMGLENITTITGTGNYQCNIIGNDLLVDLTGLNGLETNDSALRIKENLSLISFNGLENLIAINGEFFIEDNSSLISFEGLDNLEFIGSMTIRNNNSLVSFSGFESMTSFTNNIWIGNNPSLSTLNGFEDDITFKSLNISNNDILTNISGIENSTVTNTLLISNNPQLSDCSINLTCRRLLNGKPVAVYGNLQGCNTQEEIKEGCNYGKVKGTLRFDTDVNCISDPTDLPLSNWKIIGDQDNYTQITFTDNEGNYQFSAPPGNYHITAIPPSNLWSNCFDNNTYIIEEDETIEVDLTAAATAYCPLMEVNIETPFLRRCFESNLHVNYCNIGTQTAEDVSIVVFLDNLLEFESADLPYTFAPNGNLEFAIGDVLPGECSSFTIKVLTSCDSDLGQTLCASAYIYPDTSCVNPTGWSGADIRIDESCTADEVSFTIENIGTGDMVSPRLYRVFKNDILIEEDSFLLLFEGAVSFSYPADGSTYGLFAEPIPNHPFVTFPAEITEACAGLGTTYNTGYVLQFPLPDYGEPYDRLCQEVVGSFDPNDKQGFPQGYGAEHYIPKDSEIEYLIRFQNTGTDTAFTVVIRDTLSSRLDFNTLKQGNSSHNYWLEVLDEEILVFTFDNILLPDSFVNEVASNGFVSFKISTKPNLNTNNVINNRAGIYFDFNEPVITNTTQHKIGFVTTLDTLDVPICEGNTFRGITYFDNTTIFDTSTFSIFRKITQINIDVFQDPMTVLDTVILVGNTIDDVAIFSDSTITNIYNNQNNCDSTVTINVEVIIPPTIAIAPPNYYAGINEIPLADFSINILGDYLAVQFRSGSSYAVLSNGQGIQITAAELLGVPIDVGIELIYNIGAGESDTIFNIVPLQTGIQNEVFLTNSTLWGINDVATPNLDTIILSNPLNLVGLENFEVNPSASIGLENVSFVVNGNEFSLISDVETNATSTVLSLKNDYTGLIQNLNYQLGNIEILNERFDIFANGILDMTTVPSIDLTTSLASTSPKSLTLDQKIVIENGLVNQTYETGIYNIGIGQTDNRNIELTNFLNLTTEQNLFFRRYLIIENQEILVEEIFVDNIVSTKEIHQTKIELFPNPVRGGELIYFKIPPKYKNDIWEMKIYDVKGTLVVSQVLEGNDLSVVTPKSNGVFLVNLENKDGEILYSNFIIND